jgi:hypothetical protein
VERFAEKSVVHGDTGTICYKLPVPPHWKETEDMVLPIVPPSGAFRIVPELLFEKKGLILVIQRILAVHV